MRTINYELDIPENHQLSITLPADLPQGRYHALLVLEEKPVVHNQEKFKTLLEQTRGLWKQGDGLEYQTKLREEWYLRRLQSQPLGTGINP